MVTAETRFDRSSSTPPAKQRFIRWSRFNLVGGIGIAVQLVVLVALKSGLRFGYCSATAIAVEVTVIHNFLWHEGYTWRDRTRSTWRSSLVRMMRFNISNGGISLLGNLAVMEIAMRLAHIPYLAANVIAICFCALLNFWVSDVYVFRATEEATH